MRRDAGDISMVRILLEHLPDDLFGDGLALYLVDSRGTACAGFMVCYGHASDGSGDRGSRVGTSGTAKGSYLTIAGMCSNSKSSWETGRGNE